MSRAETSPMSHREPWRVRPVAPGRSDPARICQCRGVSGMGYRGEDLDLRTPQTWAGPPGDLAAGGDLSVPQNGNRASYRLGPILVDDTVLACCNQAYEMAAAHRAGEVRI